MRRIIRKTPVTAAQARKNQVIRKQIAAELPALIARHHKRSASVLQSPAP
jgi:hypothetical protein